MTTDQIEKIWDETDVNGESIFVRWSRGPRFDTKPSKDYQSGAIHSGLSSVKIGPWADEYLERRLKEYRFLQMKDPKIKAYIYKAQEIGLDSDGYELIDVATIECLGVWNQA